MAERLKFRSSANLRIAALAALGLAINPVSNVALASDARSAAGQITEVTGRPAPGDALVQRRSGQRQPAARFLFVEPGDQVMVRRDGVAVQVFLRGGAQKRVTRETSPLKVPLGASVRPPSGGGAFVASLGGLFDTSPRPIPVDTQVRTPANPGPAPVVPAMLATPDQAFPPGVGQVSLIWTGGAETAVLASEDGEVRQSSRGHPFVDMTAPAAGDFTLGLRNGDLTWRFTRSELPAGLCEDADRLERALCLMASEDGRWSLFGLGEIVALAPDDLEASRILQALRSGEITRLPVAAPLP